MSVASRAILSIFFGEQGRQNHPQYLSGWSRTLPPTTFLETAVSLGCLQLASSSVWQRGPVVRELTSRGGGIHGVSSSLCMDIFVFFVHFFFLVSFYYHIFYPLACFLFTLTADPLQRREIFVR